MLPIRTTQVAGQNIEVRGAVGQEAVYRYESTMPKPCFHPLKTISGVNLSGYEMSDHVWHRGLWFTFKYLNEQNFWEENAPYGVQVSEHEPWSRLAEDACEVIHELAWKTSAGEVLLKEQRKLVLGQISDDVQTIDWQSVLTAQSDLKLDRTPYTTWGGYGGLSFRASRELHDVLFWTADKDAVAGLAGHPGAWLLMSGKCDGGKDKCVSMGVIDHPSNPRYPTPWYCKTGNGFTFWNAAVLFHEPMQLSKGQTLSFRYRVCYGDGSLTPARFADMAQHYSKQA